MKRFMLLLTSLLFSHLLFAQPLPLPQYFSSLGSYAIYDSPTGMLPVNSVNLFASYLAPAKTEALVGFELEVSVSRNTFFILDTDDLTHGLEMLLIEQNFRGPRHELLDMSEVHNNVLGLPYNLTYRFGSLSDCYVPGRVDIMKVITVSDGIRPDEEVYVNITLRTCHNSFVKEYLPIKIKDLSGVAVKGSFRITRLGSGAAEEFVTVGPDELNEVKLTAGHYDIEFTADSEKESCSFTKKNYLITPDMLGNEDTLSFPIEAVCGPTFTVKMDFQGFIYYAYVQWKNVQIIPATSDEQLHEYDIDDLMNGGETPAIEFPYRLTQGGANIPGLSVIHAANVAGIPEIIDIGVTNPAGTLTGCWVENGGEKSWDDSDDDDDDGDDEGGNISQINLTQPSVSPMPELIPEFSFDMTCGLKEERSGMQIIVDANPFGDSPWGDVSGTSFKLEKLPEEVVQNILNGEESEIRLTNRRHGVMTITITPEDE